MDTEKPKYINKKRSSLHNMGRIKHLKIIILINKVYVWNDHRMIGCETSYFRTERMKKICPDRIAKNKVGFELKKKLGSQCLQR